MESDTGKWWCDNNGFRYFQCVRKRCLFQFMLKSGNGKSVIEKVAITNIYPTSLIAPVVGTVTNIDDEVTGTAYPNLTVNVKIGSKVYKASVNVKGKFTVKIPGSKCREKDFGICFRKEW